ncbi:hypothetical protein KC19_11G093300 [Ceratodon purpureus]|uniref:ATP-dependent DNA helicase 2 subunit KU80 n=1 Tax=Ceratodon purpureus TaxID=3225 RepID=A0A8T0GGS7_CERPU|nr:hypothetical protein KC19_11G093300 [Ceratodon purpureus]
MVGEQETLVILLDVSPGMHPYLPVASKCIATLVHRKLLQSKNDELGLVYFGHSETDNDLNKELEGYGNIVVAEPIAVVSQDLAGRLEDVPLGFGASDFLDAIVVGCDMLMKRLGENKKGNKRLCLITDAESPVREPLEGTVEEQAKNIAERMGEQGIKLDAVVVRIGQNFLTNSSAMRKNESLLDIFKLHTQTEVGIARSAMSMLGIMKPRVVSPTTLYRGDLELTPTMTVKVWVYKKTAQEKFPTLKKYSDQAPASDPHATREVKIDTEYKSSENPDLSIPPEQRAKAFKYGKNYIPIGEDVLKALKFETEKGIKLVGMVKSSKIPRHYFLKESNIFVPEPGHEKSIVAVSALVRAMKELDYVAVVRCIWRQGQTNVVMGVLLPFVATQDNVADGFYFNVIPYDDDIRAFQFKSFSSVPEPLQPNIDQQEAADNLVRMLDLSPDGDEELLQPEHTVNPILQRFYYFLHLKSQNPEAEVPPLDEALRCLVEPDPLLLAESEYGLRQFSQVLPLIQNTQKEKGKKSFWRDKKDDNLLQIKDEAGMEVDSVGPVSFSSLASRKVEEVGSANPVADFEALLARRDSPEWVGKAIQGMKKMIMDLLDSAYNGNTYEKALACLVALRSGCVIQEEPLEFNSFLQDLAIKGRGKRFQDFWQQVIDKRITLISKDEAPDSNVGAAEAASFLTGEKLEPKKEEPEDEIDEMEALLGEAM